MEHDGSTSSNAGTDPTSFADRALAARDLAEEVVGYIRGELEREGVLRALAVWIGHELARISAQTERRAVDAAVQMVRPTIDEIAAETLDLLTERARTQGEEVRLRLQEIPDLLDQALHVVLADELAGAATALAEPMSSLRREVETLHLRLTMLEAGAGEERPARTGELDRRPAEGGAPSEGGHSESLDDLAAQLLEAVELSDEEMDKLGANLNDLMRLGEAVAALEARGADLETMTAYLEARLASAEATLVEVRNAILKIGQLLALTTRRA